MPAHLPDPLALPPAPAPAGATVTLTTGAADKGKVELEEVVEATGTPRSARCRVKTEFNNAENDAS